MSYLNALRNEIAIDEFFYASQGKNPGSYGFIPRPLLWLAKYADKQNLFCFFAFVLKFFLFFGGWFFFFLIDFLRSLNHFKGRKVLGNQNCVALAFCNRAYEVIEPNMPKIDSCYVWVHFPWNEPKQLKANDINCFSLLSKKEAFLVLLQSVLCWYLLFFTSKRSIWVLQFYSFYRWLLVWNSLSKIQSDKYVCAEHFDRWAVLIDGLIAEKAKRGIQSKLIIVQHGILKFLDKDSRKECFPFKLPYRLKMVSDVFVYDSFSAEVFKSEILCGRDRESEISFKTITNSFSLSPDKDKYSCGAKFRVLFVGHPICLSHHLGLLQKLPKELDVFYKPHPTTKVAKEILSAGWKVIEEKDFFPKVDLLVSYPSTLVNDYKNLGIDSALHSLNPDSKEMGSCLKQILAKIKTV